MVSTTPIIQIMSFTCRKNTNVNDRGSLDAKPKKGDRRIQWADNNGKLLAVTEDGQDPKSSETEKVPAKKRKSRWADSKKIEIQNEKELMMQARKTISLDTDKDDELDAMSMMVSFLFFCQFIVHS